MRGRMRIEGLEIGAYQQPVVAGGKRNDQVDSCLGLRDFELVSGL
jgi:hypothetical protein